METKGYKVEDLIDGGLAPINTMTKGKAKETIDYLLEVKNKVNPSGYGAPTIDEEARKR